jgi:Flp pilus assembly protein TadG
MRRLHARPEAAPDVNGRERRPPSRRPARARESSGYVTAETALALPALVLVLALALWAVQVVSGQLRCVDAAREAARSLARGDSMGSARLTAERAAPTGAVVAMTFAPGAVTVTVSADIRGAVPRMPGFHVAATAVARLEPGVADAVGWRVTRSDRAGRHATRRLDLA